MNYLDKWISYLKEKSEKIKEELKNFGVDVDNISQELNTFYNLNKDNIKKVRIACIMDEFSYNCYKDECILFQVTPDNWKNEINDFQPDFLFVESAWEGKDKLWYRKIANISKEFIEMTEYCQRISIPVVFWNKEDPVYTDTFLPAAKCADFVFTTDIDCIKKYKDRLGSNKVYFLHFAAQPLLHNPKEKYERLNKFCFAGAYYHRYPKRAEVFDKFAQIFIDTKGFDIFDRNYQNSRPEHSFPESYNQYILGRLEPNDIDVAYKGYYYGINMNSVNQSQTMFARRVFEMMASNTVTIGNFSRGLKNLFGDLTICTNDEKTLMYDLKNYCSDESDLRKYRLLGLRKVYSEHLYANRLSYIINKVYGVDLSPKSPSVCLFLRYNKSIQKGINIFENLKYSNKKLYVIGNGNSENENIHFINYEDSRKLRIRDIVKDDLFGIISDANYYGENYLIDLCLANKYSNADAWGKGSYYLFRNNEVVNDNLDNVYKQVPVLLTDRSLFSEKLNRLLDLNIEEFISLTHVNGDNLQSIDEFNFCEDYNEDICKTVDDLIIEDQGLSIKQVEQTSENIKQDLFKDEGSNIGFEQVYNMTKSSWKDGITANLTNDSILLHSSVEQGAVRYVYLNKNFNFEEYIKEGKLSFFFNGNGNLDILGVCVFQDDKNNKIEPFFFKANVMSYVVVPQKAKSMKLGIRITGGGDYKFQSFIFGMNENPNQIKCFLGRQNMFILTNYYPGENQLYRNMFVHKRIKSYKDHGIICDILEWNSYKNENFREFEGINIASVQEDRLAQMLSLGNVNSLCIHFINKKMWDVLKLYCHNIKIFIWLHGADIQPWWRRKCNYNSVEEEEAAKKLSSEKENMWKEIFEVRKRYNLHFVFVSKQFAEEVAEDYKVEFDDSEFSVIHNCIDTDLFSYIPKNIEQRKRILSIRPFVSNNYANDLSVKCILELSKRKIFNDLEFALYGDGNLFEQTVKPLRKFKNVKLIQRFVRQHEISELHKEYGVMLIPTRLDTQGVSRDEAMSSGLVVITNKVAAVPEFTDETCAAVVAPEDYEAMADKIQELYEHPELFSKLSKNARLRVEGQTSERYTIEKEIALIKMRTATDETD